MMYSFNKLDDSSVITIANKTVNPQSILKHTEKQNLTEFEEKLSDIPFINQNGGLVANNNITISPITREISFKKASFKHIKGQKEHFIPVQNYLPFADQYQKES